MGGDEAGMVGGDDEGFRCAALAPASCCGPKAAVPADGVRLCDRRHRLRNLTLVDHQFSLILTCKNDLPDHAFVIM